MGRQEDIVTFIEYDVPKNRVIEPEHRVSKVRDTLFDVLATYNPGVIVKAGIGGGRLLYDLARHSGAYIVVVDPSFAAIRDFMTRHENDAAAEKIRFINGDFNSFPVDYYAADLLVCVDYLDFLDSGKAVDEFRRALQFDGVLFIAGTVLSDDDVDGLYDDFMKSVFPLHNDYYLRDDLKTFMDLNEFTFIKSTFDHYETDLNGLIEHFRGLYGDSKEQPLKHIEEHRQRYEALYGLADNRISEPYYVSIYTRRKPPKE